VKIPLSTTGSFGFNDEHMSDSLVCSKKTNNGRSKYFGGRRKFRYWISVGGTIVGRR
jgi:hypothetical protein